MGFIFPTVVAGLGWGDWKGGFFFAGAARLMFVHHVRPAFVFSSFFLSLVTVAFEGLTRSFSLKSTFCVNSLAHWLGETPFDDKVRLPSVTTPRELPMCIVV